MIDYEFNPDKKDLQDFARYVPAALVVFSVIFGLLKGFSTFNWVLFGIAVLIYFWGLIALYSLKPIFLVWMVVTRTIMFLITMIVLGTVFYIGFLGIGLLMRLLGKNPLDLKLDPTANSYWIKHKPYKLNQEHYHRQF